jgi:hypothetical protein
MMPNPWLFLMKIFCSDRATHDLNRERLTNLPHHYSQFDVALAWEIKEAGSETVVEGVLKNLRYALMDGIEVWIAVVNAAGETIARSVCFIVPRQVMLDEVVPFSVKLPVLVEPSMLLKFTYKYDGSDGGEGGGKWMQSFEWTVPSP